MNDNILRHYRIYPGVFFGRPFSFGRAHGTCYPSGMNASERYLTDEEGRRVAVVLTIDAYQTLLEELEELESLRAFDRAKASDDDIILLEDAVAEIERQR